MLTIGVRERERERETEVETRKNGEVNRYTFLLFGCGGVVSNIVFKTCSTY